MWVFNFPKDFSQFEVEAREKRIGKILLSVSTVNELRELPLGQIDCQ